MVLLPFTTYDTYLKIKHVVIYNFFDGFKYISIEFYLFLGEGGRFSLEVYSKYLSQIVFAQMFLLVFLL